jgi:hypothetical protein
MKKKYILRVSIRVTGRLDVSRVGDVMIGIEFEFLIVAWLGICFKSISLDTVKMLDITKQDGSQEEV